MAVFLKSKRIISFKIKSCNLSLHQKQLSRRVLRKRCSENMQQIYRITPMPKCDFNKVASNFIEITLSHGCSPVNLQHIFRTHFPKNTSGWLLLASSNENKKMKNRIKKLAISSCIPASILIDAMVIYLPFHIDINDSWKWAIFSYELNKVSLIDTLFKKSNRSDKTNFRSVSLLSHI